jgi:eukaryotic-like serine/threonine-protein kinase
MANGLAVKQKTFQNEKKLNSGATHLRIEDNSNCKTIEMWVAKERMSSSFHPSDWVQRLIGDRQRYRLDRLLGQGGMGIVYQATDLVLGRQVAIKLLKTNWVESEGVRKRFEREVSLCAALQNENIVQISDYGITSEGTPFYVMDYLNGQTLRQLLNAEKRLPLQRTIAIIRQVCAGLQLAHQGVVLNRVGHPAEPVKVVHRDLKPDNIFLVPTTLGELVKILDFGIAKLRDESASLTNLYTTQFIGTYHYAAPEQLEASSILDERADLYSLGMILYEMLTGSDPFGFGERGNKITASLWIKAHLTMAPIPLRCHVGCADLPAQLEALVLACLHKQPDDRCQSVTELSQALKEIEQQDSSASENVSPSIGVHRGVFPVNLSAPEKKLKNAPLTFNHPPGASINLRTHLTPHSAQALETLLQQVIGPIAPLLLRQALEHDWTSAQLLDRVLAHVPQSDHPLTHDQFWAAVNGLDGIPDHQSALSSEPASSLNPNSSPTTRPTLGQKQLQDLEQVLTQYIGPIAPFVLQRSLKQAPSMQELLEVLVQQIPESKRSAFKTDVRKIIVNA